MPFLQGIEVPSCRDSYDRFWRLTFDLQVSDGKQSSSVKQKISGSTWQRKVKYFSILFRTLKKVLLYNFDQNFLRNVIPFLIHLETRASHLHWPLHHHLPFPRGQSSHFVAVCLPQSTSESEKILENWKSCHSLIH